MNLDDEAETLTLRSACSRCHGHKLRCVQVRGAQGCVRCTRAGVKCVARPSRRVRQNQRQGWEHGKKNTRLEHSSSRGASRSGCRCMEQGQSVVASPSVQIAETVDMGQSRLNDLPLTRECKTVSPRMHHDSTNIGSKKHTPRPTISMSLATGRHSNRKTRAPRYPHSKEAISVASICPGKTLASSPRCTWMSMSI
jgi:hypothetical protein